LPAEILLDLVHSVCRVLIPEGDPIILEGRTNDDVYILTRGRLLVSKRHPGGDVNVAFISPGEVFGEMAFLTRRPRSATVRAVEDSECMMVKSADLRLLAYRQPSVILQIARLLAERLDACDARSALRPPGSK
jgi:CRP-like cAMP-binding protein